MNEVGRWRQRDEALEYDRAAYRALRKQGLQPPKLPGSYDLARRASSPAEIQLGQVIDEKDAARKRKGTRLMENIIELGTHGMTGKLPERGGKRAPMKRKKHRR